MYIDQLKALRDDFEQKIDQIDEILMSISKISFITPIMLKEEQKKYKNLFRYYFLLLAYLNPDVHVEELVEDVVDIIKVKNNLLNEYSGINVAKTLEILRKNGYFSYDEVENKKSGVTVTEKGLQYIKVLKDKVK